MSGDLLKKKLDKKRNRLSKLIIESNKIADNLKDDVKNTTHGQVGHKGYKRLKLPEVIERFKSVHGDTYDYSKVQYKNQVTPIIVICKEHGSFFVTPISHWKGVGCQKCKKSKKKDIEDWDDFEEVDLSKKQYKSDETIEKYSQRMKKLWNDPTERKKRIQSIRDGWKDYEFSEEQKIAKQKLAKKLRKKNWKEDFIKAHGDKYDYSKSIYVNWRTQIEVICKKCNISFFPCPNSHRMGSGCPKCAVDRRRLSKRNINIDEVKELLDKGLSTKEIAKTMGRHYETIGRKIRLLRKSK